jgi:hypothetical protein
MVRGIWSLEIVNSLVMIPGIHRLLRPRGSKNAVVEGRRSLGRLNTGNLRPCSAEDNDKTVRGT